MKGRALRWTCEHGRARPLCSASGLAAAGRRFWLVGDDLQHVVELGTGRGRRLFAGDLPREPRARKAAKRDLESLIALPGRRLLAFPSGSKSCRTRGAVVSLGRAGGFLRSRAVELGPFLRAAGRLVRGLNIEGGYVSGGELVLLQRGVGRARSARLLAPLAPFLAALDGRRPWPRRLRVEPAELGDWDAVPLSFTDGFAWRGGALVSAAAELTDHPVLDGEVKGSVIGRLDRRGRFTALLRLPGVKVEGLAPAGRRGGRLSLLAVTDADDPRRPSRLLRLSVPLA